MNNTLTGKLTSRGNLNGNVNTIVFAHNYNDLTNKPQINNVTLQGNKTASELGLATPSDITVTSVNEQTGDVVLSGSDIDYSVGMSVNAKIDDLESQIIGSGVQSVNGMTGNVTLTSNDINYSTGVTIKNKIDSVEGEIPSIYVSSVNGNSGAVTLTGSDIDYSVGLSLNDKIDAVEGEIPVIDYPVTSVNEQTGDVSLTDNDIPHFSGTPTAGTTAEAINALNSALGQLPTEIRCGIDNYSGLKGGGHPNRVNVPITFSTPMTSTQYAVFIVVSDAYSDYPYTQGYCFAGSRTVNGFTATILSMSSDTVTQVNGAFYWIAVRYK